MNRFGLTIAVPRGALLRETLDLLDRIGVETAEVRANDRKLLFADAGIVTMRPSDVPTYVEAGAADIGITGKDVLMEQSERSVFELLDLGFGRCRMVLASVADEPDPAVEAAISSRITSPFSRSVVPVAVRSTMPCTSPVSGASSTEPLTSTISAWRPVPSK